MKKLRFFCLLFLPALVSAQQNSSTKPDAAPLKVLVTNYLQEKKTEWKITDEDIGNWMLSDYYSDRKSGITYLYVHQQVKGIRIFNAVSSVSVKNGTINSFARKFYPDAASLINTTQPGITPASAIVRTVESVGATMKGQLRLDSTDLSLNRKYYSAKSISQERIRVELVYQPIRNSLHLAWEVNFRPLESPHWWNIRIDAVTGAVLQKNDWTVSCDFHASDNTGTKTSLVQTPATPIQSSSLLPGYRVYPLPLESPNFGSRALLSDPADQQASPYGWHDTNGSPGAEFNITRGNNVYAYDDISNNNAPGASANGTASLTFDFPINLAQQPNTYLDASLTNLFYVNNVIHDILWHNGFNEASGNFQSNNYGNGGLGGDFVIAEGQDGGGTDNANFSTPDDGQNGRMQMYLWTGDIQAALTVNSPVSIAGNYGYAPAGFGPAIVSPITADFVLANDGSGVTSDGCQPLVNAAAVSGKIAVIDRGTCNFATKVATAESAGAIAVIIINNSPGAPFTMSGNGTPINIPSVMISQSDGNFIKSAMIGSTVNGTLNPPPTSAVDIDGSLDNGVIIHEYGHGVSNRLTGGPSNSNCLFNGEEGGEGWSDYFAMLFTIQPGDQGSDARGMGTFALGQFANGSGIRRYPYSTNMSVNSQTYGSLAQSPEVHDIGEIWCSVLWDMTWALINQYGFDPDWISGTSGNNIALQLVLEGMKLQPCGPGFLDGRDAILNADQNLFGGVNQCLIWQAFANRGMGYAALQGDADVAGDETEDFSLPPLCLTPTSSPTANFNANITTTCIGIIRFTDSSTDIPQHWNWDFGDGTTSNQQNPIHTYIASGIYNVTLIVTNTLGGDTLVRSAYIHVNFPVAPAVTGDTIICAGFSTTLTAAADSGNIVGWFDTNNALLSTNSVFATPILNNSTLYKIRQSTQTAIQHVGPANGSIGGGSYHNTSFEGRLKFTALLPVRLLSAWVDASGTTLRTINLYQNGTLIQTKNITIPAGQTRIQINLDIPSPGNYEIGVAAGSNLYRNNSGASYPYTVNGLVSITGSNSTTNPANYYYYLYDWELQELPCESPLQDINITVTPGPVSSFMLSANALSVQLTDNSSGNPVSWLWDFGDGNTSTQPSPNITYAIPGTYTISLTVTDAGGCEAVSSQLITVTDVGIETVGQDFVSIFSASDILFVRFDTYAHNSKILVYDEVGRLVYNAEYSGQLFRLPLSQLASESIYVRVMDGGKEYSGKIIVAK